MKCSFYPFKVRILRAKKVRFFYFGYVDEPVFMLCIPCKKEEFVTFPLFSDTFSCMSAVCCIII